MPVGPHLLWGGVRQELKERRGKVSSSWSFTSTIGGKQEEGGRFSKKKGVFGGRGIVLQGKRGYILPDGPAP